MSLPKALAIYALLASIGVVLARTGSMPLAALGALLVMSGCLIWGIALGERFGDELFF